MIAGIVPVFTGSIALVTDAGELRAVFDMPSETTPGTSPPQLRTSISGMAAILRRHAVTRACIQKLTPSPSKTLIQTFNYGLVAGLIQGGVAVLGIPATVCTLTAMKTFHGLPEDRADPRAMSARLWPDTNLIQRNAHAEAALLAAYAAGLKTPSVSQSTVTLFRKAIS
jgi:hypothetical protein